MKTTPKKAAPKTRTTAEAAPEPKAHPGPPAPEPTAPLILVVDDFKDNREMYARFFKFSGYRVAEASNGHEALDQAFTLRPDLVVMDLSLPTMDGWEATRRLKKDERTRHIPVVAVTGHAMAGHEKGAKAAGCDSFLTKPCLPEELLKEVGRMLRERGIAGPRSQR